MLILDFISFFFSSFLVHTRNHTLSMSQLNTNTYGNFGTARIGTVLNTVELAGGYTINGATQPAVNTAAPTVSTTAGTGVSNITISKVFQTIIGNTVTLTLTLSVTPAAANSLYSFTVALPSRTTNFGGDQDVAVRGTGSSGNLSSTNFSPFPVLGAAVASTTNALVQFTSNSNASDAHKFSIEFRYLSG